MKPIAACIVFCVAAVLGCDNLSDYSTKDGACYMGDIIDAEFLRAGSFEAGVRLTMTLDVDALSAGDAEGAVLATSDGLFQGASARQMPEVTRDSLSELTFPGGRVRNYLAYAPDSNGILTNVVISLMQNGELEVRIFRPGLTAEQSLFGVFRLEMNEFCTSVPTPQNLSDASDAS